MADELSKDTSLFPSSDGVREDSGLQDILSVSKKIKTKSEDPLGDDDEDTDAGSGDSGMILFSAGGSAAVQSDDDDAVFGSFAGGLGAGFGAAVDPPSSSAADLTPLAGAGRVTEARPAEVVAKPAPAEQKRSPMVAIAVVLGLALLGGAAVFLTDKSGDADSNTEVAQAGMSAPEDEAAVGKAEEPVAQDSAGASAGVAPTPEPVPDPEAELLAGETEGLGALDPDAGDPLAMKDGLLENDGTNGIKKDPKWDQGTSYAKPDTGGDVEPEEEAEPKPKSDGKGTPKGDTIKGGGGPESGDAEVDCLLNPDRPGCSSGGTKPKNTEVLQPKVPEKLSTSQLREGFNGIKSSAKKCGEKHGATAGTSVKVHVSIEGSSGKVTDVKAIGEHAGTPLGGCVEDAVKNAQFEIFKNPSQGADYPIVM